ncbi:hypothetical protein MAMC_01744 [Methylacidimicrobium cyclopophantes]|uniref:AsmA-like C-terminal domain-containing protein n=2 Tax=Methylacidimicrobium cyclopophantes TaxID=1041766 RepID=A0A5E6MIB0_9BACT|nr:hypothetical protein MAMC_01744 [Methylacidimicrobium cyclopophantes]
MKKLAGAVGLLFLAVLAIVVAVAFGYWNGEGFRSFLSRKVAQGIGVEGRFSTLQIRGFGIGSREFSGVGISGSPIAELRAEHLQAQLPLSSLLQGVWTIDPIRIGRLEVIFRSAGPEANSPPAPSAGSVGAAEAGEEKQPEGLRRVSLRRGEIESADLRWPPSILGGGTLTGIRVTMEASGSAWKGKAGGGKLTCAALPSLSLEEILFRLDRGVAFLDRGVLHSEGSGTIRLVGRFRWEEPSEGRLRFSARGVALAPWLPAAWRDRVAGDLEARGRLTASAGEPWKAEADLSLLHGKLQDLPWLVGVAVGGGTPAGLPLDRAQARLVAGPGDLAFEKIEIESKGAIRIEGNLHVQGERLSGALAVGLTAERVALLPGAREKIFSEERNGYLWTPVTVSGTVQDPQEDLSPRLAAVAKEAVKAGVQRAIRSALDFLRRSQNPPNP